MLLDFGIMRMRKFRQSKQLTENYTMENNEHLLEALFAAAFSPAQRFEDIKEDERFQELAKNLVGQKPDERVLELFEYAVMKTAYGEDIPEDNSSLTYGKVMYVFKDYLAEDKDVEIVKVKHGYAVFVWNEKKQEYIISEGFPTPQEFASFLANSYAVFHELQVNDNGTRDLTPDEKAEMGYQSI